MILIARAGMAPENGIICHPTELLQVEPPKHWKRFKDVYKTDKDVLSRSFR